MPRSIRKIWLERDRWSSQKLPIKGLTYLRELVSIVVPSRLNLSWIVPNIAVGGRFTREAIPYLARLGITDVVDCRLEYKDNEEDLLKYNIRLLYLPTPDGHAINTADLARATEQIMSRLNNDGKIFIHCHHGIGRSVMLAVVVLATYNGHTIPEAISLVRKKRWQAALNYYQINALNEFMASEHATPLLPVTPTSTEGTGQQKATVP